MSSSNGSGMGSSPDSFEERLSEVVFGAVLEGINVEGGWEISSEDNDLPEFGVEIYRVER